MRKERRRSATVRLAVAVFLSALFAQTTDAFRLTKTTRRDAQREIGDAAVQEGRVFFGADFGQRSDLESLIRRVSDAEDVQADFAGWAKGLSQDAMVKEAAWRRMSPSLQCVGDQMRFRVVGQAASQLALAQANSQPLPLTNIPPNCGFNMQRNSVGLVMVVPYDGCNVVQQGGAVALPLRFQGIPVLLLCARQMPPPLPSAPFLPLAPVIDIPPAPQLPSAPVPKLPQLPPLSLLPNPPVHMVPPVFPGNGFLVQDAFDPRFSSRFAPSFLQFPTLANPPMHVLSQNPNFFPAQNAFTHQMFPSLANAPLPHTHLHPSLANAPLPHTHLHPSLANAPLPHTLLHPSLANAPLPHTLLHPSLANAPLPQTHLNPSLANAPLLRTHLPPGYQPGVGRFQPVPDPGVKRLPQFSSHTHFLPMYPQAVPRTRHLPEDGDPWLGHSWPAEIPLPTDPKPGMMHLQGSLHSQSHPHPATMHSQSDPWPGMLHSHGDPKPEIIPLPESETVESISPPAQSRFRLHGHPFRPASLPDLPQSHSHSHHLFDIFPPSNTKG